MINSLIFDEMDSLPADQDFMLTTKDNPYNPFTNFDEWNVFDIQKGYCSLAYLARIVSTNPDMPDEWNDVQIRRGIEEIIRIDPFDIYTKAFRKPQKAA